MKLEILENSKNYACTVIEIKELFSIEGADKIQKAIIFGNNVVVSKNVKVGDKMLYFVSGTKLNSEYCHKNNLYDKAEENYNKEIRGFISHKQKRVKAIKLKGIISDGILMPLNSLKPFLNNYDFKVGVEFNSINGNILCEKYIVPVKSFTNNQNKESKAVKISRLVDNQFYLHNDTVNLRKNIDKVNPDDIISIHYKKHGTSVVIGNVLVKKELKWYERLLKKIGVQIIDSEYDIVYSSRKVIKNEYLNNNPNSYYKTDIWKEVKEEVKDKIPKNYTIYGEILGFESSGSYIQKDYDYGCEIGKHKFYVYKISIVNSDGKVIYLTDKQIEQFCEERGLLYKDTFIYYGKANDYYDLGFDNTYSENDTENWRKDLLQELEKEYNEKDCYMCVNKVPEEGIVLRVENAFEYVAYKLKSKRFLLRESEEQEKETINLEDNDF